MWPYVTAAKPDVFAFIGDNIYADTEDMTVMAAKYEKFGADPHLRRFRSQVPVIATWDDHDFGINDGGEEYPKKPESKALMLKFFNEPATSPRWSRDGVYTSYFYGDIQVILMDLRWFRSPLISDNTGYLPNPDPSATMLGETQWQWLQAQLALPARFRILASSTQFVSGHHQWEKWANFPFEKARMLKLFDDMKIRNLVVVSGDMHFGELSMETTPGGFDLYDLTSSGLNFYESSYGIPNPNRLACFDQGTNFGLVTIDGLNVTLELRGAQGQTLFLRQLDFSNVDV